MFDNVQVYTWAYLGWETEAYCIILSGPVHVLPWCRCQRQELHTCSILKYFTQSVSEGLSSHLIISYHLIFSSSYLLTSSHLQIFSPSHLLIFNHLHIFSHLQIFSHLLIFTSSHLHIFSHLFISFTSSSHLLHIFFTSSSHLIIFTSWHLLIFTSSHLPHIFFTSSHFHFHTFSTYNISFMCSLHSLLFSYVLFITFYNNTRATCSSALSGHHGPPVDHSRKSSKRNFCDELRQWFPDFVRYFATSTVPAELIEWPAEIPMNSHEIP